MQVVLAAVRQDGCALQFASPELRAERATVLAAVMQSGGALQFASDALRADADVVRASVRTNPRRKSERGRIQDGTRSAWCLVPSQAGSNFPHCHTTS